MKWQRQKKGVIRKRSFLLIEVLIALTLVALSLFPLMKEKTRRDAIVKKEAFEGYLYLRAKEALVDLIASIDENHTYTLEELLNGVENYTPTSTSFEGRATHSFYYTIKKQRYKKEEEDLKGLILKISLSLKPNSPKILTSYLLLQKGSE